MKLYEGVNTMSEMPHSSWFQEFYSLSDLICLKMDQGTDLFMQRVTALQLGKTKLANYIEEMYLKPTDYQVTVLCKNLTQLIEEIEDGRNKSSRQ